MKWTSRERVIAAINHIEADRVPINIIPLHDFYINLKAFLGIIVQEEVKPSLSMEVVPHPQVLKQLGVDIIRVKMSVPKRPLAQDLAEGYASDEWGVVYKRVNQPGGGSYFEVVQSPLCDATLDDLEKYPWPDSTLPGVGEMVEKNAKSLYENTDLALMGRFGGPIIELPIYLMGMQKWMVRTVTDPKFAAALLDKITDVQIAYDRVGLEASAKYLQIFRASGEDLGTQTSTLYSPRMFKELILPRLKRRWQADREIIDRMNPSVKIMLHSCGGIRPFIQDMIDGGIQILDPVQPKARGMDSFRSEEHTSELQSPL
jgi:uroporphyrinogen decarboxylase